MRQFYSVPVPGSNMKRRNLISPLVLLAGLFFVLLMVSCSKEGPAGADGAPGPKGDPGTGSSSVIYSDWLDVPFKADTIHTASGRIDTIGYYADIEAPKLTLELLGTADVKVYINTSDVTDPRIISLPYFGGNGGYIEVTSTAKTISIYSNMDVSTYFSQGRKYYQFRYMIVPGNTKADAAVVNWADYAEAKAYLKLED